MTHVTELWQDWITEHQLNTYIEHSDKRDYTRRITNLLYIILSIVADEG